MLKLKDVLNLRRHCVWSNTSHTFLAYQKL